MKKNSTLFFAFLLFSQLVNSQPTSQTFDGAGTYTYTVSSGYSVNATIQVWGGGGGGGSNSSGAKGGGSGGSYASSSVTFGPGNYTVIVGSGGQPGMDGTASSFSNMVIAAGGGSTNSDAGGVTSSSTGGTGNIITFAEPGASANAHNGGKGGDAGNGGGAGGAGGIANNGSGMQGAVPGGGGGGKAGPDMGGVSGAGADGRVIITVNSVLLPLPVKFNTIKAFEKQQAVQIEWTVFSEQGVYKYEVERSIDGVTFSSIGNVGPNNSTGISQYHFLDPTPLSAVNNFYRIKSIDMNSSVVYSTIIKINLDKNLSAFTFYPNPTNNGTISFQSSDLGKGNYSMTLYSPVGLKVYTQSFVHTGGAINLTIQLPASLQPGMYNIQLATGEKKWTSKKIIIE